MSVKKINTKLKKLTFLNEKTTWMKLYEWFKSYVTNYVVRELARDKGVEYIKNLDQVALNKLFQDHLVKHTQMDAPLMIHSVTVVEEYLQKWISKIIQILDKVHHSNSDL